MAASMQPLHVYRRLLRAIDRHLTRVAGNGVWREHAAERFRAQRGLSDPAAAAAELRKADEAAFLMTTIAQHKARAFAAARQLRGCPLPLLLFSSRRRRQHTHRPPAPDAPARSPPPPPKPQALLVEYNIGQDADERNSEMIAKTARRVGFEMPNVAKPDAGLGRGAALGKAKKSGEGS